MCFCGQRVKDAVKLVLSAAGTISDKQQFVLEVLDCHIVCG